MLICPPLKPNSATFLNAVSGGAASPAPGKTQIRRRGRAVRLALILIRGYKLIISPLFAGSCRFVPSCSDYASEAVGRHSLVAGGWLALRRIGRCHPFGAAGHDPVPPRN